MSQIDKEEKLAEYNREYKEEARKRVADAFPDAHLNTAMQLTNGLHICVAVLNTQIYVNSDKGGVSAIDGLIEQMALPYQEGERITLED